MSEAGEGRDDTKTRETASDLSFADASAKFMADQAAVMTMMTAVGVNLATQVAGLFMGAMADALDKRAGGAANGETPAAAPKDEERQADTPKVVPLKVVGRGRAPRADDLKKISGIGPKLEKVLNGMGIRTFADIAKWDDAEALRIDEELGLDKRIIRDGWVRQAKALLEG